MTSISGLEVFSGMLQSPPPQARNGQLQTLQRNVTTLAGRPGWAAADQGNSTADIWRNTVTGPLKPSKPHGRKKTVVWCAPPITARSQTRSGPNIHIRVTVHYATPSLACRCPTPAPTDDGCSSSPGDFKFSAHGILQLVCWYRNTRSLLDPLRRKRKEKENYRVYSRGSAAFGLSGHVWGNFFRTLFYRSTLLAASELRRHPEFLASVLAVRRIRARF
ncbi:uncharacterized protein CIMG_13413 [Coccidioides immitis RS]|uniref:Uncharacterized protein n=1 Tax=Coccidioides immitis (strain RS) TaxID=246410 RepID=A0A0D8JVZ9_COCIM|nr:uncharacterized protein CIMG_13413 [Coccidioides immitis RS]KJF61096.1 hypothetical protein CIMG_13413 [Coccidioides immitis RS]